MESRFPAITGDAPCDCTKVPGVFHNRNFSLFFTGQFVSTVGIWSQMFAMMWLGWKLTRSPAWLGMLGFSMQIPSFFVSLFGGAVADRYNRLNFMILIQLLLIVLAFLIIGLILNDALQPWHLIAFGVAFGAIFAVDFPARQAFVTDTVGGNSILQALSLTNAASYGGRIIGPAVSGIIVVWKGEWTCFVLGIMASAIFIVTLFLFNRREIVSVTRSEKGVFDSIIEGFRCIRSVPQARFSVALIAVLSMGSALFSTLMPVFAGRVFGGGATSLGWLMGASAVGSTIGALLLARRSIPKDLLMCSSLSAVCFSVMLIVFGFISNLGVALPVLVVSGLCFVISFSTGGAIMQELAPAHLRGRMAGFYGSVFLGVAPLGNLMAGGLADTLGVGNAVILIGTFCLVLSTWIGLRVRAAKLRLSPVIEI